MQEKYIIREKYSAGLDFFFQIPDNDSAMQSNPD